MIELTTCPICRHSTPELLWDLPRLPQTEKYGPFNPEACPGHDQNLLGCTQCGHVFLRFQLEPRELYTCGSYKFRSAASGSARNRNRFFAAYWHEVTRNHKFAHLVDAGGNDFYLIKLLEASGSFQRTVVDPIWSQQSVDLAETISVRGLPIDAFDFAAESPPVDALVSSHTFEHLPDPRGSLERILHNLAPGGLVVLEIPDWDSLVASLRFDCIFHQHYHYFSLSSLSRMISLAGGELLDHRYNPRGTCGGSLLATCRKRTSPGAASRVPPRSPQFLRRQIGRFRTMMDFLREEIDASEFPVFGYGASLLLGTLCYHLRPDFGKFGIVYDDDPGKHETGYENIPIRILDPSQTPPPPASSFLITSLENQRTIQRRICDFQPGRIIQFPIS